MMISCQVAYLYNTVCVFISKEKSAIWFIYKAKYNILVVLGFGTDYQISLFKKVLNFVHHYSPV